MGHNTPMGLQVPVERSHVEDNGSKDSNYRKQKEAKETSEAKWCIERVHIGNTMKQTRIEC